MLSGIISSYGKMALVGRHMAVAPSSQRGQGPWYRRHRGTRPLTRAHKQQLYVELWTALLTAWSSQAGRGVEALNSNVARLERLLQPPPAGRCRKLLASTEQELGLQASYQPAKSGALMPFSFQAFHLALQEGMQLSPLLLIPWDLSRV